MIEALLMNTDPDLPISADGKVYHLACTAKQLAEKFILVGDPGRVPTVAECFDPGSIEFDSSHREIRIITGRFQGIRVSVLSTGMGTDNMEIVINEIHALKEHDLSSKIHLIRVGTCGSPRPDVNVGALAITQHAIGLDNTCRYYVNPHEPIASVVELANIVNATKIGHIGVYTSMAHPEVTSALVDMAQTFHKQEYVVGITASASGFYGCQGRAIGRFRGLLVVENMVDELGAIRLGDECVVNIEMENSALCFLSHVLGYKAGTICVIIAKRSGDVHEFVAPEIAKECIRNAIMIALNALIAIRDT